MERATSHSPETREHLSSSEPSSVESSDQRYQVEAAPQPTAEEAEQINLLKERLLEQGVMTIESLEGDPFVLSRNHVSTGEGVTIYHPDGRVEKMTLAEDRARRARERHAVRYIEDLRRRYPQEKEEFRPSIFKGAKKIFNFARNIFSRLFSGFWKFLGV